MAKSNPGWERAVNDWAGNDPTKVAIGREVAERFKSVPTLVNHARGLVRAFREDKKARVFPDGKGVPAVAVIVWCMLKSMSGDVGQWNRWCMYRPRKCRFPADPADASVVVKVAVPDRVDPDYQVLIRKPPPADVPVISIDDEEEPEVQVIARRRVATVEGDKEKPIDVELLADVDVPVKMDFTPDKEKKQQMEEEAQLVAKRQKKQKKQPLRRSARLGATPLPRRSARLKIDD